MSNQIQKYKKRKSILKLNHNNKKNRPTNRLTNILINVGQYKKYNTHVSNAEAMELLNSLENDFNDKILNDFIDNTKKDVLSSIVGPLGIGKFVAKYDKLGGNVDTIHNVRVEVYATDEEKMVYDNREEYKNNEKLKKTYHDGNDNYSKKKEEFKSKKEDGKLTDAYSGKKFDKDANVQVEHVIATEESHNDAGRILSELDGAELANADTNLQPVIQSVNSSKSNDSVDVFVKRLEQKRNDIEKLENKETLTPKEEETLARLKRTSDVDDEKMKLLDKKARDEYNSSINKQYYTSGKFIKNTIKTSANEGLKMGTQQAIGILAHEFFDAIFDEIYDIYKEGFSNGYNDEKILTILRKRLEKIVIRVKAKWKDVVVAFGEGLASGFFSGLITVFINAFKTTSARLVRIIREGIFSLLKAVKMLAFPPANMTFAQVSHEASKIIATALAVSGGIVLEEYIDNMIRLTPGLEIFADTLTAIFVGALTGILTALVIYSLDKLDIFGANEDERHKFIMTTLENNINKNIAMSEKNIKLLSNLYIT